MSKKSKQRFVIFRTLLEELPSVIAILSIPALALYFSPNPIFKIGIFTLFGSLAVVFLDVKLQNKVAKKTISLQDKYTTIIVCAILLVILFANVALSAKQ